MKKLVFLLVASILIVGLGGCSSQSTPSDALLEEDVINALAMHNQYASVVSTEMVKSITNEDSYEVTMHILAETKYADWEYEVDLTYLNYDQGWMMDEVSFSSEKYTIKKDIDASALTGYCLDYLGLNTSNNSIVINSVMNEETEHIIFSWYIDYPYGHAFKRTDYWIEWNYDSSNDNWVPCSEVYDNENDPAPNYDLDFSGEWDLRNPVTGEVVSLTSIIIKDFTWEGFIAQIPGYFNSDVYFENTKNEPKAFAMYPSVKSNFSDIIFTDGNGKYITFKFHESHTLIFYFDDYEDKLLNGYTSTLGYLTYVEVNSTLPKI